MVHEIGCWHDSFGALNVHEGEYETNQYWTLWAAMPVWLSYRGSYHVVGAKAACNSERDYRLHAFWDQHCDLLFAPPPQRPPDSGGRHDMKRGEFFGSLFSIPLRRRPTLGWMTVFHLAVSLLGVGAAMATITTPIILISRPRPLAQAEVNILSVLGSCFVVFIPLFYLYRRVRRPSTRQHRIRGLTRERFGPYSDPAAWVPELACHVLPTLGARDEDLAAILREARSRLATGNTPEALLLTRLGMALVQGKMDSRSLLGPFEELTDECLGSLNQPSRKAEKGVDDTQESGEDGQEGTTT